LKTIRQNKNMKKSFPRLSRQRESIFSKRESLTKKPLLIHQRRWVLVFQF